MHDPFEESLRDLLEALAPQPDDDARLGQVLKTVNHQIDAGDLSSLAGHWLQTLMIDINSDSPHLVPVSRTSAKDISSADRVE